MASNSPVVARRFMTTLEIYPLRVPNGLYDIKFLQYLYIFLQDYVMLKVR